MSLLHSPIVMPPRDDLRDLLRENEDLKIKLREANLTIQRLEDREGRELAAVAKIREALNPLYSGLQQLYGVMEGLGTSPVEPKSRAVWDSWKQKLGGKAAEAIDVLLLHGTMNADQLRIHLRCARTHVYNVISQLNKSQLIHKDGGRITLKSL